MNENRPIYYCMGLDYTPYPVKDLEDYMGEENDNLDYHLVEIKSETEIEKSEFHNVPYSPAVIKEFEEHPEDFLNVSHVGDKYSADLTVSFETYQQAYNELLAAGTIPHEITASTLSTYVEENKVEKRAA